MDCYCGLLTNLRGKRSFDCVVLRGCHQETPPGKLPARLLLETSSVNLGSMKTAACRKKTWKIYQSYCCCSASGRYGCACMWLLHAVGDEVVDIGVFAHMLCSIDPAVFWCSPLRSCLKPVKAEYLDTNELQLDIRRQNKAQMKRSRYSAPGPSLNKACPFLSDAHPCKRTSNHYNCGGLPHPSPNLQDR